jgi:hypothetical protein
MTYDFEPIEEAQAAHRLLTAQYATLQAHLAETNKETIAARHMLVYGLFLVRSLASLDELLADMGDVIVTTN